MSGTKPLPVEHGGGHWLGGRARCLAFRSRRWPSRDPRRPRQALSCPLRGRGHGPWGQTGPARSPAAPLPARSRAVLPITAWARPVSHTGGTDGLSRRCGRGRRGEAASHLGHCPWWSPWASLCAHPPLCGQTLPATAAVAGETGWGGPQRTPGNGCGHAGSQPQPRPPRTTWREPGMAFRDQGDQMGGPVAYDGFRNRYWK